jgi:hypothetical protein
LVPVITGLAYVVMGLAGVSVVWGVVTAIADKPPGAAQLVYAGLVELATLLQSALALIGLALGERPAETATTLGYLIGVVLLIPAAWFWANNERTRYSGIVLAVAALAVLVMTVRLLDLWATR